jgi:hypothetical protein
VTFSAPVLPPLRAYDDVKAYDDEILLDAQDAESDVPDPGAHDALVAIDADVDVIAFPANNAKSDDNDEIAIEDEKQTELLMA